MNLFLIVIVVVNFLNPVNPLNILGLFPHPGKSHVDVFLPLMKGLAAKGHKVTVISNFPLKTPMKNYIDIVINDKPLVNVFDLEEMSAFTRMAKMEEIPFLSELASSSCKKTYETPSVQEFLKSNQTFDVAIMEFFNTDCMIGIAHQVKASVVGISSCAIMPWTHDRFGNPSHPAYIPNILMDYSDKLTFLERVENTFVNIFAQSFYEIVTSNHDQKIIEEYLGNDLPPIQQMINNVSLLLLNSHFTYNRPRPYVPPIIEVGGLHIGKHGALPKDLEEFVSKAKHGVVYFSMGSMIRGETFPEAKRKEFLKAFARLPQRVLWKYESEMTDKSDNILIKKWMPQLDILCHPNVVAFISHGGLLGTTEAVHCGVPVIVMPIFGDQHTNARALEASGGGVILHFNEASEDTVYNALQKVLDPNFQKSAKSLSERFRDRPLSPLETAIYWVEYVARHKGAHHMRTAAVGMPLYQYFLLDVIAFILGVILVFVGCLYCSCKACVSLCSKRDVNKVKTQ